jgi:hypothetical protein
MSSATSPVRDALEGYVAGHVQAERVVTVVAAAYYGARGRGPGDRLRPLMDVIERAHPGVIELSATADEPGFAVSLGARPFPNQYEAQLRQAAEAVLGGRRSPGPRPRVWSRLYSTIRTFFTASA